MPNSDFFCVLGEQLIKANMLKAQYPNGLNAPAVRALEALSVAIGPQKQAQALVGLPRRNAAWFFHAAVIER